jgi:outer membrane biosynthesis protein TonB
MGSIKATGGKVWTPSKTPSQVSSAGSSILGGLLAILIFALPLILFGSVGYAFYKAVNISNNREPKQILSSTVIDKDYSDTWLVKVTTRPIEENKYTAVRTVEGWYEVNKKTYDATEIGSEYTVGEDEKFFIPPEEVKKEKPVEKTSPTPTVTPTSVVEKVEPVVKPKNTTTETPIPKVTPTQNIDIKNLTVGDLYSN